MVKTGAHWTILIAVWCSLLAAAPAVAAPAWLAPVDLSGAGQNAFGPQVAVDSQGNAIAVWQRSNGTNQIVQTSIRPAGGGWQAPVDLSAPGQDAAAARVVVDSLGNAIAVWQRSDGTNQIAQASTRPAAGGWQAPVDLSAAGQNADRPQVAVDQQGNAIAVWRESSGAHFVIQAAVRPAGGGWQGPADLSAAGQNSDLPQVALDPSGTATVVWQRYNGSDEIVQAAVRPAASGAWLAPVDLSGPDAFNPQVAVDAQGNTIAVWALRSSVGPFVQGIQAAVRPAASGSWQAPMDISMPGHNAFRPHVAVDPGGNAVAVWDGPDGSNQAVQAAVRPAGGSWQAPVDLSPAGRDAFNPQVAVDAQGDAVAVWYRFEPSGSIVQGAARPAGGSWQAPTNLSAPGQHAGDPQVAVDPQGNAVATWARPNTTNTIVQAAGYDATRHDWTR